MPVQPEKSYSNFKRQSKDNNHKLDTQVGLSANNTVNSWKVSSEKKFKSKSLKEPSKGSTPQKDTTPIFHQT